VCTFAQYGAVAALNGGGKELEAMVVAYREQRQLLTEGLKAIPGVALQPPRGAFYAFPDISSFGLDSMDFSRLLLDEQGLAVVPGKAFGDDRCVRLSCAAELSTIEDGLERLRRFIEKQPVGPPSGRLSRSTQNPTSTSTVATAATPTRAIRQP